MKRMKKAIGCALAVTMMASLFAGCSAPGSVKNQGAKSPAATEEGAKAEGGQR